MSTSTTNSSSTTEVEYLQVLKESFKKFQLVPLCIIIVVGFLANVAVIWNGMTKKFRFKHYSNYFILSLAFADLGVVMMAIPVSIVEYTSGLDISQFTCAFIITIRETFQSAAMQTVTILGLARLTQITRRHRIPISKRGSMIIVIAIWLNSYLLVSLPFAFVYKIDSNGICDPYWPNEVLEKIHLTFTSSMLSLPLVVVTISYIAILKKIKNLGQPNSGNDNNADNNSNNDERTTPKSRNLSILLTMLIITCWISYAPLAFYTLCNIYEVVDFPAWLYQVISVLFFSSSAIDPVLILIMSREYRFRLTRRFGRKCRVGNARDQNQMIIQNPKNSPLE